uniref:beta-N-acetylhexosaminidase n=1 Tax=Macrostomum lignano TaxID=282301 RepID=A0A1I8FUB8_9PLAT
MSMLAWFPVSRHQLTPLLLLLVPIDLILCQNRDPDFGNSNSRLIQHEPGAILHKEVRQKLATPAVPTQRPIPDDVGLAGENNFALLDPPDTEFHVWRAPFPSVGEAWPRPTRQYASRSRGRITAPEHLSLAAKEFQFVLTSPTESDCPIAVVELLKMAFQRYRRVIVDQRAVSVAAGAAADADGHIRQLSVRLTIQSSDEKWRTAPLMPSLDMDESYTLKISKTEAVLSAPEPWGVLRGLQTFSQLVWQTQDAADAMEMNKLNVFHWHIVDDQSFPYQSVVFPKLSEKIIEYARVRGIRVIPEFDTPAHTHSWSLGYPEIFTQCFNYANRWTGFYGPMNPALNATFDFLKKLYAEISSVFKDNYIHLGADEVGTSCCAGKSNSNKRGFIVWQEAYDHGVMLKRGTIVQVWKGEASDVAMVAQAGYRVLYSTCWYLDRLEYGPQWTKMYLCDPIANYAGTYNGGPFQQQMPQQQPPPQQQQQQQ